MKPLVRITAWVALGALGALLLAGGCTSDTCTCPGGTDETGYPDQSTPDGVVEKLEMAYEAMDSEAYAECLAEDFAFFLHPDEVASEPELPEYWGKPMEQVIHSNVFADTTTIESITLTLAVVATDSLPGDDPGDPSDDLWQYDVDVDLRVQVPPELTILADGRSRFVMRRSPGRDEVMWQIVEHRDVGEGRREETTWTAIKLLFGGPVEESLYPVRTDPGNVLLKLEMAYERMDAEAYLDCLADSFVFLLNPDDLTDDPELPESWDKVEEAIIHGNMFGEDTDVQGIALWLVFESEEQDTGDPGDPLDDRWTCHYHYDLRVQLPPDLTLHAASPVDFVVGIDPDDVGHGGTYLWEIVTWSDLPDWGSRVPDPASEACSWGRIKAMFR